MKPTQPFSVRAVFLDLDGTLLDTALDLHMAACAMLRDMGRPVVPIEATRRYVGRGVPLLVKRLLADRLDVPEETPAPPEAVESFRHHYARENGKSAKPYAGVLEGLNALRQKGLPLGIITNKPTEFVTPLLARMQMDHFFSVVMCGDSLPRRKPDPMPIVWACGRLGISPAEALMIGDSLNDVKTARAAGSYVFLVPYGYNEGKSIAGLDCDALIARLDEAVPWIDKAR